LYLIPANYKPYSGLAALRVISNRLSKNVSLEPRTLDPKVMEVAEGLLGIRLRLAQSTRRRLARSSATREPSMGFAWPGAPGFLAFGSADAWNAIAVES
jgi:hypothetical protein